MEVFFQHSWVINWQILQYKRTYLSELKKFFLVSCGAIPGALIRWNLNNDLLLNLIGALILGFIIGYNFRPSLKLLIGVGFCGSLTTFSRWILDCFQLFLYGHFLYAFCLIVFPVLIGLFVSAIGHWIGSRLKLASFA